MAYSRAKASMTAGVEAGDGRGVRGRPFLRPLAQRLGADRVPLDVVAVFQAVAEDHVHHAQGQRGIGAGQQRQVLVRLLGRAGAEGIDRDQLRAPPPRLLDEGPQVDVRAHDVGAPGHDEPGIDHRLGVEAHGLADRDRDAGGARAGADRAVEEARPQRAEEAAVHAAVREQPHVPGVGVGQDRLGTVGGDHAAEARGDGVEGLVPRDAREAPLALGPDALHRVQDAVGAVDALEVVVDLRAEEALGEPVIGVAAEAHRAAVLDVHGHDAGVGAVVGTDDLQPLARRRDRRHGAMVALFTKLHAADKRRQCSRSTFSLVRPVRGHGRSGERHGREDRRDQGREAQSTPQHPLRAGRSRRSHHPDRRAADRRRHPARAPVPTVRGGAGAVTR